MILILLPTTLLLTIVTWLMKLTELFVTGDYIHFLGGGGRTLNGKEIHNFIQSFFI